MIRKISLNISTELLDEVRKWKRDCNIHRFNINQSDLICILIMNGLNHLYGHNATVDRYQALHDLRIDYKTYTREYLKEE